MPKQHYFYVVDYVVHWSRDFLIINSENSKHPWRYSNLSPSFFKWEKWDPASRIHPAGWWQGASHNKTTEQSRSFDLVILPYLYSKGIIPPKRQWEFISHSYCVVLIVILKILQLPTLKLNKIWHLQNPNNSSRNFCWRSFSELRYVKHLK